VLLRLLAFAPGGSAPPVVGKTFSGSSAALAVAPQRAAVAKPVAQMPKPAPVPAPLPASAPTPSAPTELGERWFALVNSLQEKQLIAALVRELAVQSELVAQGEGAQPQWCLRVERESLRSDPLAEKLREALATLLEMPSLQLTVEAGAVQDSPARRVAAERERRQQEAERIIQDDPLVQDLLAQFPGARIVPGSIKPD
jgi:DNA polymerase III subunit gamma/tau